MTKYEWEKELRKNIHRLPDGEIQRVLDYYGELFDDNIERGKSERDIIYEFGNPVDVADKILSEFDGELKSENVYTPPPQCEQIFASKSEGKPRLSVFDEYPDAQNESFREANDKRTVTIEKNSSAVKSEKSDGNNAARDTKLIVFVLINVFTCFSGLIVMGIVWIVLSAMTVAFGAIGVGGIAAFVISFGPLSGGAFGSGIAHIGIGLGCVGLGILGAYAVVCLIRCYAKLTARFWKWLRA